MDKLKNKTTNKNFGYFFGAIFFILGLYLFFKFEKINIWIFSLSFIFFVLGFFNSKLLSPLNYIWFKIGIFLGNIISPLVMLIIYFLIVTPISILLRMFKKDILELKKNKRDTYWINREKVKSTMRDQF
tara:strand:- start:20 stop:406 length:387 start_codon:yes stop_codon:yes gene_type:complete